ncbi:MAG TPA: lipocalin-like domain-containing protein [Thermoanaerobaculia bacterium]|nr:lipocalin-like domain-containing protein [Thermoanaerobaculia bacterium]
MNARTLSRSLNSNRAETAMRGGVLSSLILALVFLVSSPAVAQQKPEPFRLALPGYEFEFPRDHGSHPEFGTEWWYYTGHLTTKSGKEYGFELTFFRVGTNRTASTNDSQWDLRDVSLAHFALTDVRRKAFRFYEKLNRSSLFTANAAVGRLEVFNESWRAVTLPDGRVRLQADGGGDSIDLVLRSMKTPAIHGENGISVKAAGLGYASHYYSLTRIEVVGRVRVANEWESCRGIAWMDHEFGSATLRESQQGWDWFSIQFDNETELMLYQIRKRDGSPDATSAGSFVMADGSVIHLRNDQFRIKALGSWTSPASRARYPMGWQIDVLPLNLSIKVTERLRPQELLTRSSTQITYWEGAVAVQGSFERTPVRGVGYVEMTGYDRAFRQPGMVSPGP